MFKQYNQEFGFPNAPTKSSGFKKKKLFLSLKYARNIFAQNSIIEGIYPLFESVYSRVCFIPLM